MGRLAKMRRREILSGKAPFGLKWNKEQRKIEVDPKEEKVYRQIVDWVLKDGLSLAEVNRQLKKGTHYFTTAKLSYIVRNRTYLGEFVVKLFDRDKKTGKKIPRPENEWMRAGWRYAPKTNAAMLRVLQQQVLFDRIDGAPRQPARLQDLDRRIRRAAQCW